MLLKVIYDNSSIKDLYSEYMRLMNEVEVMETLAAYGIKDDREKTNKQITARRLLKRIYTIKATYN